VRGSAPAEPRDSITARHSISIKLSALHPRYRFSRKPGGVMAELYPVVEELVRMGTRGRHSA
jgi:proline dehydrogenase